MIFDLEHYLAGRSEPVEDEDEGQPLSVGGCLLYGTIALTLVMVGGGLFFGLIVYPLVLLWQWPVVAAAAERIPIRLALVAGLCAFGVLLYIFRSLKRFWYGICECSVGAVALWVALSSRASDRLALGLAIAGGLYIIVRGLDNMAQARSKPTAVGKFRLVERDGKLAVFDANTGEPANRSIARFSSARRFP